MVGSSGELLGAQAEGLGRLVVARVGTRGVKAEQ